MPPRTASRSARTAGGLAAAGLCVLLLSSCGGDSDGDGAPPEEVLEQAQQNLDDTSGLQISLSTDDPLEGNAVLESAQGVATHAPAFEGSITVKIVGQSAEVPIVAVDDQVYAEIPFTQGYQVVNPGDYGAPDPAQLMAPGTGFSSLLTATTDVEEGESVRGGADNDEVLTEYTGTLDGDAVRGVMPSAQGEFDVSYTITEDNELRSADLTGVFFDDSDPMTYTLTFEDYGIEPDISAP
ncbi:MAG: LppX_LprAFG lipoprotein [Nocardioides sp.]